jgi:PAS domain S-box-containing protein
MQVGFEEFAVVVVAGQRQRARELAAVLERNGSSLGAATGTEVERAVSDVAEGTYDGVVVETGDDGVAGEATLESLRTGEDGQPVVVVLAEGSDLSPETALDGGATAVVDRRTTDGEDRVLANRVELAMAGADAARTAREARQRYHRLLDESPAAIVIFDADGEILYANAAAAEVTGAEDPHAVAGRTLFELLDEETGQEVRDQLGRLLEDRETVQCEDLILDCFDGRTRYVESAVTPVTVDGEPGGQAVLTDVTTLKERERRLRTERDRFTALFESLPEAAVHVKYRDGDPIVQNVNEAFEDVFGFEHDTIAGENLDEFIVPSDHPAGAIEKDDFVASGGHLEREVERETADGVREFLFSARSMHTAEGTDEGVGIYVDITDRKRREEALERQNERLDAFASIVSHDLKSPLSVANGNLYLAREEDDDTYLDQVEEALDRMERIIDDLLRLARNGEGSLDTEPVDAGTVVAEAWTEAEVEGASLVNEFETELEADRGQLRELLVNLVRNAVEHGGEGVTVTVGLLGDHAGEGPNGFYVADDGPGIPPEDRQEVFEPGFTTHDDGTGFGLVVVAEIAEAHGWETTVTESEDGGARFEFRGVATP